MPFQVEKRLGGEGWGLREVWKERDFWGMEGRVMEAKSSLGGGGFLGGGCSLGGGFFWGAARDRNLGVGGGCSSEEGDFFFLGGGWGRTQPGTGTLPLQTGQHSGELTANCN